MVCTLRSRVTTPLLPSSARREVLRLYGLLRRYEANFAALKRRREWDGGGGLAGAGKPLASARSTASTSGGRPVEAAVQTAWATDLDPALASVMAAGGSALTLGSGT
jgi:hypothetical protein